jgi:hypothetical protein
MAFNGLPGVTRKEDEALPAEMTAQLLTSNKPRIGIEEIKKAGDILAKYKEGKANLESRIVEDELWWELRHWEAIKKDYVERMEVLKRDGIRDEVADFKRILSKLTSADYEAFMDEGELPNSIAKLCYIDTNSNNLMSKKYNVAIGTLYDIIDAYNDREASADVTE